MVETIKQYESVALNIEPSPHQRATVSEKVFEYTETFLNNIRQLPIYVMGDDNGVGLYNSPSQNKHIIMLIKQFESLD